MYPSDVAECLQVLADGYTKAAEDLLPSPGDFEAETANGNVVENYLLEKRRVVTTDNNDQIHGKHHPGASREFTI
jgi:hypothetical protein